MTSELRTFTHDLAQSVVNFSPLSDILTAIGGLRLLLPDEIAGSKLFVENSC